VKKVLILALALVLLLGIAARGTFGLFSDTETSSGNTFTAWVEECAKFNVSDKSDAKIYKYDADGNPAGSFDLSGDSGFPVGVAAVVGGDIYVLDHPDHKVYQYTCSGTCVGVSKDLLKAVGTSSIGRSQGLDIYDTQMWVVSGNDKNIYQYLLGAVFPGPGTLNAAQEIGLNKDNKGAVALAETRFYRYDRITGVCGIGDISKVLLEHTSDNKLQSPAGAMFDGTSLWVVDRDTNKVYEYDMNDTDGLFAVDTDSINASWEFDLHLDNTDASGV